MYVILSYSKYNQGIWFRPLRAGANTEVILRTVPGVCVSVDRFLSVVKDTITKLDRCKVEIKIKAEFRSG